MNRVDLSEESFVKTYNSKSILFFMVNYGNFENFSSENKTNHLIILNCSVQIKIYSDQLALLKRNLLAQKYQFVF